MTKRTGHRSYADQERAAQHSIDEKANLSRAKVEKIPWIDTWRNNRGWLVVEIDYRADPRKRDPEWRAQMIRTLGEARFRREILHDWTIGTGMAYYPEFSERGRRYYVREMTQLMDGPVYRGLDFGHRYPACVWLQTDKDRRRVWVLREFMPRGMDAASFRDAVRYLSGQIEFDLMLPGAKTVIKGMKDDPAAPEVPFFNPPGHEPLQFINYAGHEIFIGRAEVGAESKERTTADIWQAAGETFSVYTSAVSIGTDIIRLLMQPMKDDQPGMLIDASCKVILQGLDTGIVWEKPTPKNPIPQRPFKDGYFDHLHECLQYVLVNLIDFKRRMQMHIPVPDHRDLSHRKPRKVRVHNPSRAPLRKHSARKEPGVIGWERFVNSRDTGRGSGF